MDERRCGRDVSRSGGRRSIHCASTPLAQVCPRPQYHPTCRFTGGVGESRHGQSVADHHAVATDRFLDARDGAEGVLRRQRGRRRGRLWGAPALASGIRVGGAPMLASGIRCCGRTHANARPQREGQILVKGYQLDHLLAVVLLRGEFFLSSKPPRAPQSVCARRAAGCPRQRRRTSQYPRYALLRSSESGLLERHVRIVAPSRAFNAVPEPPTIWTCTTAAGMSSLRGSPHDFCSASSAVRHV